MKKINFVFLGNVNSPNGAATFFKSIINNSDYIEDNNTKVSFFHSGSISAESEKLHESKMPYLRKLIQKMAHINSFFSFMAFYIFNLRHAKEVVNRIVLEKNNQWIFNDIFTAYYFIKKYPHEKSLYLILHNNGDPTRMIYETYTKLEQSFYRKRIEKEAEKIIKFVKRIILLSPESKKILIERYSKLNLGGKVEVVENGSKINIKKRRRKKDNKMIGLSVGSISYRKGFDFLVEANNEKKFENISILCVGNIQDVDIKNKNKKENIIFLGSKNSNEVSQLLADADFFILCSRDEGMPISIIEAMQYKLPIFATKVGAIPEMLSNGEGVLIEPNKEGVLKVLQEINNKVYNFEEIGLRAFEKYKNNYSIDKMLTKYKNILNEDFRA